MNKKLSVVICVYNTKEDLFKQCLNSVFNSTYKNMEVVIVDDGSTLNYDEILKEFPSIRYFKTENQGTLKARLFGIKQTSGDYVCFVDSDDTVSFDYFEAGLSSIDDADIVINDWAFNTKTTKYFCANDSTIKNDFVNKSPIDLFFKYKGEEHSYYVLWNKVFKRDVLNRVCEEIEKTDLNKVVYAEDVLMTYFAFANAKKIKNVHLGYYFYRIHTSQQVSVQTVEKFKNHVESINKIFAIIKEDLKTNNHYDSVKTNFASWKQMLCSTYFETANQIGIKEMFEILKLNFEDCELKKKSLKSSRVYLKHNLLPNNIEEIDEKLKKVFVGEDAQNIYVQKKSYAYRTVQQFKNLFNKNIKIVRKENADIVVDNEKITFKQKLLHNQFVVQVGLILFPKGSKIRKFLKERF